MRIRESVFTKYQKYIHGRKKPEIITEKYKIIHNV